MVRAVAAFRFARKPPLNTCKINKGYWANTGYTQRRYFRVYAFRGDLCNNPLLLSSSFHLRSKGSVAGNQSSENDDEKQLNRVFARSVYDESSDWRDWFSPIEYENPWDSTDDCWLEPLEFAKPTEIATRHLLQLLQELYRAGRPLTEDRVTTAKCNHVLQQLLVLQQFGNKNGNSKVSASAARMAKRADAILQAMELFDEYHYNASGSNFKRSRRLPMEIPRPNRETYHAVLKLYSRAAGPRSIPERVEAIAEKMELRYRKHGELDMMTNAFHWNCALMAWKECEDWEKPAHAFQLFLDKRKEKLVDASSYIILMLACARNHPHEKSKVLGAEIAVKLWQETFELTNDASSGDMRHEPQEVPELKSHFYAFFLQAIRFLPTGKFRDHYFDVCFARVCEVGKLNEVIVQEFLMHVRTSYILKKYIKKEYLERVVGLSPSEASKVIVKMVPASWTNRAD